MNYILKLDFAIQANSFEEAEETMSQMVVVKPTNMVQIHRSLDLDEEESILYPIHGDEDDACS